VMSICRPVMWMFIKMVPFFLYSLSQREREG
jgi:hypothetical protein